MGIGTWEREGEQAYRIVSDALEIGYRHVDTAEGYGNEAAVGRAIADAGIPRDQIFITTKVAPENFGAGQVLPHVHASLERLGVDKVDLLLAHYPAINDEYDIHDYIAQFATVREMGLCSHIGVSNFTKRHIDLTLGILGGEGIATNQVECHVLLQNRPIVDHMRKLEITVTAYCPLAHGHLNESVELIAIADKYDATPQQVALAFLLAEGHVVIPSSSKRQHIKSNWDAQGLNLSSEDIDNIRKLDSNRRMVDGPWCPKWDNNAPY